MIPSTSGMRNSTHGRSYVYPNMQTLSILLKVLTGWQSAGWRNRLLSTPNVDCQPMCVRERINCYCHSGGAPGY